MNTVNASLLLSGLIACLPLTLNAAIVNVAIGAKAYTTSPLFAGNAISRITDGDRATSFHGNTAIPAGFAYSIDLGKPYALDHLTLYPRQDACCPERLSMIRVSVHDDDGAGNPGAEVWGADLFTDGSNPGSTAGAIVNILSTAGTGTFTGRWIQIKSLADPVPDYALQLTEVEVYAEGLKNFALNAPAFSDRPLWNGFRIASLTDGNLSGVLHADTDPRPGLHYDVNLGVEVDIDTILIIARQDGCCPDRLSNYRVTVHKDSNGSIGDEVWGADLHTDASNPGATANSRDVVTADLGTGSFRGQWVRLQTLSDPVPSYSLQMNELLVFGSSTAAATIVVSAPPTDAVTRPPRTATFAVNASVVNGDPSKLTYQWQQEGVDIPGATAAAYTTPSLSYGDAGKRYRCVISYPGTASITTSSGAILIDHALGAAAFSNQPLWAPGNWNIGMLVDGNRNGVFHGGENITDGFAYTINMGIEVTLESLVVWARQDGCCPARLTNYRVSVHQDNQGTLGNEVWRATLHADASNPGSSTGSRDVLKGDLDPAGEFKGQWVKIESLESPVQNYALQMTELEAYGTVPLTPSLLVTRHPASLTTAPYRSASFSVEATVINGDPARIGYQWQRNGVVIAGATGATYTTPRLTPDDDGAKFRCLVSYPGLSSALTDEAAIAFDFNYARKQPAYSNRSLWIPGGWNISMLVDGDRNGVFHGGESIQTGFAYRIDLGLDVEIDRIDIYPRQDGCCPARFSNIRVSLHKTDPNVNDEALWFADLYTDGTNPGAAAGTVVSLTADLDPSGTFAGRWIQIGSLQDPPVDYALQMTEIEIYGRAHGLTLAPLGNGFKISWGAGVLESATEVVGPWSAVPNATGSLDIQAAGQRNFYRLRPL